MSARSNKEWPDMGYPRIERKDQIKRILAWLKLIYEAATKGEEVAPSIIGAACFVDTTMQRIAYDIGIFRRNELHGFRRTVVWNRNTPPTAEMASEIFDRCQKEKSERNEKRKAEENEKRMKLRQELDMAANKAAVEAAEDIKKEAEAFDIGLAAAKNDEIKIEEKSTEYTTIGERLDKIESLLIKLCAAWGIET